MDLINGMANFMVGTILFSIGATVLVAFVLLVNNLVHKYWKPITMFKYEYRYIDVKEPE